MMRNAAHAVATWFGIGLLPTAPGSWASLAALPFAWLISRHYGAEGLALAAAGLFMLGWAASAVCAREGGVHDPSWIVVDEVVGQWFTLTMAARDLPCYAVGLVAFRIADIAKPFPVGWADRRIVGPFGIMFDDVVAAIYAGAVTAMFHWYRGWR